MKLKISKKRYHEILREEVLRFRDGIRKKEQRQKKVQALVEKIREEIAKAQ